MDELAAKLQALLNTPQGREQLQNIQSMFGLSQPGPPAGEPPPAEPARESGPLGGLDLAGLFRAFSGGNAPAGSAAGSGSAGAAGAPGGGAPDLSGLASLLGGLAGAGQTGGTAGFPQIDPATILKLQKVFQSLNVNDKNSQLLLALKPHFGERRRHRVDQAISLMRLFAMLPALRESGIFAGL